MFKISKNVLRLCTFAICCVLLAVQIVYIVRLHMYEKEMLIAHNDIRNSMVASDDTQAADDTVVEAAMPVTEELNEVPAAPVKSLVVVLDPGHGKSSGAMTAEEKTAYGWVQNSSGNWGEWRHWKSGTVWQDCNGSGCNGRAPSGGGCWYPIGNGDRDIEPDINLQNALAAKRYLEDRGYTVRMTRTTNDENPSLTRRLTNCYPNNDINSAPDAIAYVCIHSNAGGATGSAYLSLSSGYDHAYSCANYEDEGNYLGRLINDRIVSESSMGQYSDGHYAGQPDLILFHKSPVPIAYLEIGFFDDSGDLSILRSESNQIGTAIAEGIIDYVAAKGL